MYKTNKSKEKFICESKRGGENQLKFQMITAEFVYSSFALMGTKCSNENLFLPSGRKECAGCLLADTLFIVGVKLVQDPGKSHKVCRPYARKIRNAADCFTFITGKLTENDTEPKEQRTTGLEENSSTPSTRQNRSRQVQVQSDRKDCCRQQ